MDTQSIYLNHAGTSWPKPNVVIDAVRDAMRVSPYDWGEHFEQAHQAIAAFFGIRNFNQLLLTPGCTSSLAIAVADIDCGGRNRVLTSAWEHHAMHRPLLKLAEHGVTIDYVPPSEDSALDLNKLEQQLSKGDVGLVAMTASANVTGDLLPVESVVELAHRYDAQVLLDAAQVVGWLELDFCSLGADLIAFGGHKGLQAPWGIGGLYIAEQARMKCVSAQCELATADRPLRPGYCDAGSVDQVALAGLHAAVRWLRQSDRPANLTTARHQISRIASSLISAGARCSSKQSSSQRMPTVAFSFQDKSSSEIAAALKKWGVIVGSGLQCAPLAHQTLGTDAIGLTRISVGIEQSENDIQAAISVLEELLTH
ncbi:MAG: aminotransferase class V-fold PLP-dependent enzyme [Pseudomonadota bacterium]